MIPVKEDEIDVVVAPKESCMVAKRLFRLFGPLGSLTLLMVVDMVAGAYLFIYLEGPQEVLDRQVRLFTFCIEIQMTIALPLKEC